MSNLFNKFGVIFLAFALIMISFVPIQGFPGALSTNLVEEEISLFDLDQIIIIKKTLVIVVQNFLSPHGFPDHLSLKPQNIPAYFLRPPPFLLT